MALFAQTGRRHLIAAVRRARGRYLIVQLEELWWRGSPKSAS
jgi:hypothetical protein